MLIEFSVKNFMSFKDKVTLSMEKGNGEENLDNVFFLNNESLLKSIAIYGANASGKSNILKAFNCAILMVKNSNIMSIGGKWNMIKPFKLSLDIDFNRDQNKIYDEILDAYYSQKPTNIFTRKNTTKYEFSNNNSKLESFVAKNPENKLFLATATNWNYEATKDAYLWFSEVIDIYDSFDNIKDQDLKEYSSEDKSLKEFALKLLKELDILIKDMYIEFEESKNNDTLMNILMNLPVRKLLIELEHEVYDENNKKKYYKLNFNDESSGTKVLFAFAPYLMKAFNKPKVIIVDELEKSLHPNLVEFIIKLFNNKDINKANSQLIFTSHATNLLNLELLRRDQIWFTEKKANTGVSDLFPLDSFSVRKDENISKGYINGRYGAIPFIKDVDLWLEDK